MTFKRVEAAKSAWIPSELTVGEEIEGRFDEQGGEDKLCISTDLMDIEFMLPRARAGPLVVPYVAYQHYRPL